jgi:hypothetical protein
VKTLYHGTTFAFDQIDLNKGKGYKDFGRGFYATAVLQHAERIAKRNKKIEERRQQSFKKQGILTKVKPVVPYVYYLLYDEDLTGLKIKKFTNADTEWVRFIMENRNSPISIHDFDIVIGPTADAETTLILNQYAEDLRKSNYDEDICLQVVRELKPENLPKQYFFGTEVALKALRFDQVKRQVVF